MPGYIARRSMFADIVMTDITSAQPSPPLRRFAFVVLLLYFLSGVTGLAYQVLWARLLSLQFGVSLFGVIVVAAAFMLGLGHGALTGSRWSRRVANPLRLFAVLEAAVAGYALLLPAMSAGIDAVVSALDVASLTVWYVLHGAAALLMIALPAWAMGLGFPMVLRALEHVPAPLAKVYGLNTLGGALGALLPLALLPVFGWRTSLLIVAALGCLIAFFAFSLAVRGTASRGGAGRSAKAGNISLFTLIAYGGVGGAALMLEVGWTRLFGMLLLRTEYVMAVILMVFLAGIGLGSLLARSLTARWWFELLPLAGGGCVIFSLWMVPVVVDWVDGAAFANMAAALAAQTAAIVAVTLPATLVLGAWLPMLSRRFGGHTEAGGRLYGANAIGAAAGALIGGFLVIPLVSAQGAVVLAALMLFGCGMVWVRRRWVWAGAPVLAVLAAPVAVLSPVSGLLPATQADSRDLAVYEDALDITHVIERPDGNRLLLSDLQRMDASSDPAAVTAQKNQARLPLILHGQPQQVLFLGLGTGISAAGSLPLPDAQRTAVELSQGAIIAAREWFAPVNGNVMAEMTVVRDDARRFLRSVGSEYDVIIGDLFHPDLVGRGALLTVQQFERVKARLASNGVFVQWLALNQFDTPTLMAVWRSFQRVFDDAVVFVDGFRIALVGGRDVPLTAARVLDGLAALEPDAAGELAGGEGAWTWLGRYWGPLTVASGPVQDEWAPVIEYRLPRLRYGDAANVARLLDWLLQQRPTPERAGQRLQVSDAQFEDFERAYVGVELGMRAWLVELAGRSGEAQRLLRLAYQANPSDQWVSGAIADRMYASLEQVVARGMDPQTSLEAIVQLRPDHTDALRALWRLHRERGDAEQARHYRQRLASISPLDAALREVQ